MLQFENPIGIVEGFALLFQCEGAIRGSVTFEVIYINFTVVPEFLAFQRC
jgi:hypothetical protein